MILAGNMKIENAFQVVVHFDWQSPIVHTRTLSQTTWKRNKKKKNSNCTQGTTRVGDSAFCLFFICLDYDLREYDLNDFKKPEYCEPRRCSTYVETVSKFRLTQLSEYPLSLLSNRKSRLHTVQWYSGDHVRIKNHVYTSSCAANASQRIWIAISTTHIIHKPCEIFWKWFHNRILYSVYHVSTDRKSLGVCNGITMRIQIKPDNNIMKIRVWYLEMS